MWKGSQQWQTTSLNNTCIRWQPCVITALYCHSELNSLHTCITLEDKFSLSLSNFKHFVTCESSAIRTEQLSGVVILSSCLSSLARHSWSLHHHSLCYHCLHPSGLFLYHSACHHCLLSVGLIHRSSSSPLHY